MFALALALALTVALVVLAAVTAMPAPEAWPRVHCEGGCGRSIDGEPNPRDGWQRNVGYLCALCAARRGERMVIRVFRPAPGTGPKGEG